MAEFKNPLSWSISKSTVLHYCVKKYYFSTYSNYLREVDMGLRNDAMVSKNIKSLAMWLGECLHDLMSDYLNLVKDNQLNAYIHHGYWQCMDTLREKEKLEKLWNSGKAPWKIWED